MSTLTANFANTRALADLLDDIRAALRRYLVIGDSQFITLALYALHTHAFEVSRKDAVGQYPYHTPLPANHISGEAFRKDTRTRSAQPARWATVVL